MDSLSLAANSGTSSDHLMSPKLSLIAGPFANTEFFFNAGRGFHSNDARGTTITTDPKTGDPVDKVPALVSAKGIELGARTEAIAGLQSSLALWQLKSDSELVYVGDAGTTEPSGASTRRGVEFNNRWIPVPWFLLDADFAWTHARFDNGDRIPNALDRVASLAATLRDLGPWSASLQLRYLGPGALIEDNSVRSTSSTLTNLRVSRKLGSNGRTHARRVQPVRSPGQRHPVLLRVAVAGRSGAGGRSTRAPGRAAQRATEPAGAVLSASPRPPGRGERRASARPHAAYHRA